MLLKMYVLDASVMTYYTLSHAGIGSHTQVYHSPSKSDFLYLLLQTGIQVYQLRFNDSVSNRFAMDTLSLSDTHLLPFIFYK